MVFTAKLLANVILNVILYFIGLYFAWDYHSGFFASSLGYAIFLIAAYLVSYYLDGHPHIMIRFAVAAVLGGLTFNFVAAVLGPAIFAISCTFMEPFLGSIGKNHD